MTNLLIKYIFKVEVVQDPAKKYSFDTVSENLEQMREFGTVTLQTVEVIQSNELTESS